MTLTAIILILISAFTHVGWNLLCKREHPSSAFFLLVNTLGTLCLIPATHPVRFRQFPHSLLPYGSCLSQQGFFRLSTSSGWPTPTREETCPFSTPSPRSSPVIVVIIVTLLFDQCRPGQRTVHLGHCSWLSLGCLSCP